eukprot:14309-Heterococcus_DN1.PRE.2
MPLCARARLFFLLCFTSAAAKVAKSTPRITLQCAQSKKCDASQTTDTEPVLWRHCKSTAATVIATTTTAATATAATATALLPYLQHSSSNELLNLSPHQWCNAAAMCAVSHAPYARLIRMVCSCLRLSSIGAHA